MWALLLACGGEQVEPFCLPGTTLQVREGGRSCLDEQGRLQGFAEKYEGDELVMRTQFRDNKPVGAAWRYVTDTDGTEYVLNMVAPPNPSDKYGVFSRRSDHAAVLVTSVQGNRTTMSWPSADPPATVTVVDGQFEPRTAELVNWGPALYDGDVVVMDVDPVNERVAYMRVVWGASKDPLVSCGYPITHHSIGGLEIVLWESGKERVFPIYEAATRFEQCTSEAEGQRRHSEAAAALDAVGLHHSHREEPDLQGVRLAVEWMDRGPMSAIEPTLFGCPCLVGRWPGKTGATLVYRDPPGKNPALIELVNVWQEGGVAVAHWRAAAAKPGLHHYGFVALR